MAEIATEVASTIGAAPSAEIEEPSSPPSPPRDLKKGNDVYCFHGPSLYLARIVDVRLKEEKKQCLIHYFGWKKVHDEWLDTDSKRLVPVDSKRLKQNSEFIVQIRKAPYASKAAQHLAKFVKEDDTPKKAGSESPNVHSGLEKLESDKPRSPKVRSSSSSTHSTKSNKENTEGSSSHRKRDKSDKKKSHAREGDSEEKVSHLKKHKKKSSEKDRHRSERDKHRAEMAKHDPEKETPGPEKEKPCLEKETPGPKKEKPDPEKKLGPEKEKPGPEKEKPGPEKEKELSLQKETSGLVAEKLLSEKLQKERSHKHRDKPHKEKRHKDKDKDREKKRHSSSHHGKHKDRSSLPGLGENFVVSDVSDASEKTSAGFPRSSDVDKVKKIWDQLLSRRTEPSRVDTADVAEASPQQETPDAPKKEAKPSEKSTEMQAEKEKLQQKAVEGSKSMNFDWAIKALPSPSEEPKKKREGKKEAGDKKEPKRTATSSKEPRKEKNPESGNEKTVDVAAIRPEKGPKMSESSEKKKEKLSSSGEGNGGLKSDGGKKKGEKICESITEKGGKVGDTSKVKVGKMEENNKEKTSLSLSARKISESDAEKLPKKHEGKAAPEEKDPKKAAPEKHSRKRKLSEDAKGSQDAAAALAQPDSMKNSNHQSNKADGDPKDENNRKRKKRRLHTDSETSSSSFVSEAASSTSRVHSEAKGIQIKEKMIASGNEREKKIAPDKGKEKKVAADKEKEKKVAADKEKEKKVVAEKEKKRKKIADVKPEKPANTKKQTPAFEKEHEKQKDLSESELDRERKVKEKRRTDGELQEKQKPVNRSKDEQQKEGRARPAKEGKERKLSASSEPSSSAPKEKNLENKAGLEPHTSGAELVDPSSAIKKKPVAEVIPQTMQPPSSVSVTRCVIDHTVQKDKDVQIPTSEEKEQQKRQFSILDDVVAAAEQAKERREATFKSLVMSAEATLETPSTPLLEELEKSDKKIVIMGKAEWEEHQLRKLLREQERRRAVEKELKKIKEDKERKEKEKERTDPTPTPNVLEKSLKVDSSSSMPPASERVTTKRPKTPSEEPEPSEPKKRRIQTEKQPPPAVASSVKDTAISENVQVATTSEQKPQPALKEERVEEEVPAPEIPPQPSSSVLASPLMRTASHVACPSPATPDSPLRAPVPPLVHRSLVFPEEYKQQEEVKEEAVGDEPMKEENDTTATEDTAEERDEEQPVEDYYDSEEDFTEGMEVIDEVGDDDVEVGAEEEPVRPPPVKRGRGRPKRIVRVRLEIPPEFAILLVRDDARCKASDAVAVRAASVPVNEILRRYVGSKTDLIPLRARVVRGAVSVLKELFDMALPTRLLYVTERASHRALMERLKKPPGDVYGGIYLLRLLCSEYSKLVAYCMNHRDMDERKAVLMMHYIYDIVAYMREEFREWYDGPEDDIDEIYEKIDAFEPEEDSSEEDSDEEEGDSDEDGEMNGDGYDEDSEEEDDDDDEDEDGSDGEKEPVRRSCVGHPRFRVVNGGHHGNGEH